MSLEHSAYDCSLDRLVTSDGRGAVAHVIILRRLDPAEPDALYGRGLA